MEQQSGIPFPMDLGNRLSSIKDFQSISHGSTQSSPQRRDVPGLVTTASSVSNSTVDTELVSPISSIAPTLDSTSGNPHILRELSASDESSILEIAPAASIGRLELNKGSKRTASGVIKAPSPDREFAIPRATFPDRNTRAFEVSSELRTRLKYAMLKVQNGWTSQNMDQVTENISNKRRISASESPATEYTRRQSIASDSYLTSPMASAPDSQYAGTSDTWRALQNRINHGMDAIDSLHSTAPPSYHPHPLAPALPIVSPRKVPRRATMTGRAPPPFLSRSTSYQSIDHKQGGGLPRTPTQGAPIHRSCEILQNQAEKDAVDSLLFMSSPKNSANMKFNSAMSPPSRPGKRVEFDMSGDLGR